MKKNFLFLFIVFTTFSTMAQELKQTFYQDGAIQHQAEVIMVQKNAPSVLVLPAWMGIDFEARNDAKVLAQHGYNVFIADIYGIADTPKDMESAKKMSSYYKEHPEKYRHKIKTALNEFIKLGANKEKIAVIGYCFGGTGALEAARGNMPFTGAVSIHGGLKKADTVYNTIQPKVLISILRKMNRFPIKTLICLWTKCAKVMPTGSFSIMLTASTRLPIRNQKIIIR